MRIVAGCSSTIVNARARRRSLSPNTNLTQNFALLYITAVVNIIRTIRPPISWQPVKAGLSLTRTLTSWAEGSDIPVSHAQPHGDTPSHISSPSIGSWWVTQRTFGLRQYVNESFLLLSRGVFVVLIGLLVFLFSSRVLHVRAMIVLNVFVGFFFCS